MKTYKPENKNDFLMIFIFLNQTMHTFVALLFYFFIFLSIFFSVVMIFWQIGVSKNKSL